MFLRDLPRKVNSVDTSDLTFCYYHGYYHPMASVVLKGRSSHWFACFKIPTGKTDEKGIPLFRRVQRSTGSSDKTRAQQLAISYERAAVAAGEKRWTENSARKFLAEIGALSGVSIAEVEQVGVFMDKWIVSRKKILGLRALEFYENTTVNFAMFMGSQSPMSDVTAKRVSEFREAESAAGKGASTINKSLAILRQAFTEATAQGIFTSNPAEGLNIKGAKRAAQKRSAYTFAQFRDLVRVTDPTYIHPGRKTWKGKTLHPDWQTIVMVCGYTGARQQEAAQLEWRQVDLAAKRVCLSRTKTHDMHWLPLHQSLAAHLQSRWEAAGGTNLGPVMPHLSAVERRHISNQFRRCILPRIGIVQAFAEGNGKGRRLAPFSLHSLRHSLATWLAEAGVEEAMRMQLIGHEDETINRGYTHTQLAHAAAALSKVPTL